MKTRTKWLATLAGVLVLSAGIGRAIVAKQAQQAGLAQSTASAQGGAIMLTPRDVVTAAELPLQRSLAVSGSLVAQRAAIVKAKVAAELLQLTVREGDAVSAGQIIGRLDTQEFKTRLQQAQQQAASAKAQWQIAQQNLDNSQALVKQGFVSRHALDTALSQAASARANFEAAQAAVTLASKALNDCVVRAPIAGLIAQRFVQAGERVGIDARLVEIVDLSSLELQAPLSAGDVLQVKPGAPASLEIEGMDRPLEAKVARINPSASSETRTVMVYLAMTRDPGLRQGLFAQGRIWLDVKNTLTVPLSAVLHDANQDHVLRVQGTQGGHEAKIDKVAVQLGWRGHVQGAATSPDMVQVLSGLQAGDQVITRGSGIVQEGQLVALKPH